jgi:hypothetical protein
MGGTCLQRWFPSLPLSPFGVTIASGCSACYFFLFCFWRVLHVIYISIFLHILMYMKIGAL